MIDGVQHIQSAFVVVSVNDLDCANWCHEAGNELCSQKQCYDSDLLHSRRKTGDAANKQRQSQIHSVGWITTENQP